MKLRFSPLILGILALACDSNAASYYWDINGTAPGAGNPATGGWTTSATNWNPASDGASATPVGWINGSDAIFSAGSDAVSSFTVTPDATATSVNSITYNNGGSSSVLTIAIGSTIQNATGEVTVNGAAGTRLTFNSVLAGSNGLTKKGVGALEINSSIATYTGNTYVTEGILRIVAAGRLPSGTLVDVSSGAILDVRGNGNTTIAGLTGLGTVYEGLSGRTTTLTVSSNGPTSRSFTGTLDKITATGVLNLTKSGSFTQELGGTSANTYDGVTTVQNGILALAKTAGVDAIGAGGVIVSGGTLRLDAANQIADASVLELSGGTFDLNGTAGESFSSALSLDGDSVIHFGSGLNSLIFGSTSVEDWGSYTLTITGFTAGTDLLRFGTSDGGLSPEQLALLRFADYGGAQGVIDEFGYVTPIPEPSSVLLLLGTALPFLGRAVRSQRAKGRRC